MAKSFVYEIVNKITGTVYVGKSNNPNQRFKSHMSASHRGSIYLAKAVKKYGSESFELNVIGEFESEELAYEYERLRIEERTYQGIKLYNLCAGGRGIIMTPQLHEKMIPIWQDPKRLKKISDASLSNWKSSSFRDDISFKVKAKFRDPVFKKKHSDATRAGMTDEVRNKISETHRGRIQSEAAKLSRAVGCKNYWANNEEQKKVSSERMSCDKNPNAKISVQDVIKCRVLDFVFDISVLQIARILSLPPRATRHVINSNTWKSISVTNNDYLTESSLLALLEIMKSNSRISPSKKTTNIACLTEHALKDSRITDLYNKWKDAIQGRVGC